MGSSSSAHIASPIVDEHQAETPMSTEPDPGLAQDRPVQDSSPDDSHPEEPVSQRLQQLLANPGNPPEVLEAAVEIGVKLIDRLVKSIEDAAPNPGATSWLKSLRELQVRAEAPRTVVGVVGNTGAGKSSVINALIDEERSVVSAAQSFVANPASVLFQADSI